MRYGLALLEVENPGRYEGLESGALVKDWAANLTRVALCFPDVYEIGMSHLGLPILYEILNREPGILAERAFAPWKDMEALLRRRRWPLVTRESGRPLRDFDLIGFTLQYELSATNILAMLELGGVPLLAAERRDDDPIVIGGGPVASNPEPLADFFDAFLIGDGEDAVREIAGAIAEAKQAGKGRGGALEALGGIEGVYLPSSSRPQFREGRLSGFEPPVRVRRRTVPDLGSARVPERPIVGFISTVHERLSVELARGCARGCRFCQAGFLYRPVRERTPEWVRGAVERGLKATGHEEVGLLSLSTGDYSCIGPLLASLMDEHAGDLVSVSLPSMRVDSLDPRLLEEVSRVRKTGFTVAPEAGSERLRRVINKNLSDADILEGLERVFSAGWKGVKLYFMIGLPTETREDWGAIVELSRKIARLAPAGRGRVTVSISNFVPKPHTPFQWCEQVGPAEIRAAQEFFKGALRDRKIELKWHSPEMSALEGILARGDRRLGAAILAAYRSGCRMDGWTDEFRWEPWSNSLSETGLGAEEFLRARSREEVLPWAPVDTGVDPRFLWQEWEKALRGEETGNCRADACTGCGVCDFDAVMPRAADPEGWPDRKATADKLADPSSVQRIRFRFRKLGPASFLSHLETVAAFHRALRASGVALIYSQGFNPHPKLNLGPALRLGVESLTELGEARVWEVPLLAETQRRLNEHLPEGLRVEALWLLTDDSRGLTGGDTSEEYEVEPTPEATRWAETRGGWGAVVEDFWAAPSTPVVKRRMNKPDRALEAREFVEALEVKEPGLRIRLRRRSDGTTVGPEDLVRTLSGMPGSEARACDRVLKIRSNFS